MTAPSTQALVIRDSEGEYYVVSLSQIQQGRVAEEHRAALESALADETTGYAFAHGTPFGISDVRVMDMSMPIPKPKPPATDPTKQWDHGINPFAQPRPH